MGGVTVDNATPHVWGGGSKPAGEGRRAQPGKTGRRVGVVRREASVQAATAQEATDTVRDGARARHQADEGSRTWVADGERPKSAGARDCKVGGRRKALVDRPDATREAKAARQW